MMHAFSVQRMERGGVVLGETNGEGIHQVWGNLPGPIQAEVLGQAQGFHIEGKFNGPSLLAASVATLFLFSFLPLCVYSNHVYLTKKLRPENGKKWFCPFSLPNPWKDSLTHSLTHTLTVGFSLSIPEVNLAQLICRSMQMLTSDP